MPLTYYLLVAWERASFPKERWGAILKKGGKLQSRQMQLSAVLSLGCPVHAFFRNNFINDSIQHTVENEFFFSPGEIT